MKVVRQAICLLLCVTMAAPMNAIVAAEKAKGSSYNEVVMGADHSFNGRLVNSNGDAVEGAAVKISQNGKVVGETSTNKDGEFTVAGLESGPYMVQAGKEATTVRLWEKDMAPPAAKEKTLLVSGGKLTRGQIEGSGLLMIGLVGLSAVTLGTTIKTNGDISDLQDTVDELQQQLASP